jgi:hypothetical protein
MRSMKNTLLQASGIASLSYGRIVSKDATKFIPSFSEACKMIESSIDPEVYRKYFPRIYRDTGKYGSPNQAALMTISAMFWDETYKDAPPISTLLIQRYAIIAQKYQFPTLFVEKELLAAVIRTEPPSDTKWEDMKMPYEAGLLCLPVGMLRHPTDGAVNFLAWARFLPDEGSPFSKFGVWTVLTECPTYPTMYSLLRSDLNPYISSIPEINPHELHEIDIPLSTDEESFLDKCRAVIFGTFLALESRPSLISYGRKVGVHKKSRREIWEPNVIGRGYRIIRLPGETGTHSSPRMHWRRGHYRWQPFGAGLKQSKRIWIEPMLIGASE